MNMANEVREREPEVARKVKDGYFKELTDLFVMRPQKPSERIVALLIAFLGLTVVLAVYLLLRILLSDVLPIEGFLQQFLFYLASVVTVALVSLLISAVNYRWCCNSCDRMRVVIVLGILASLVLVGLGMPTFALIEAII